MRKPGRLTHPVGLAWCLLFSLSSVPAHAVVGWLATSGNHIINSDGSVWIGRGANLHDTRSCGGGTLVDGTPINDTAAGVTEVKRRIDELTDVWKASFIRLALETRRPQDNYIADLNYRGKVKEIVDHIGTKPGVYVLVSIWQDPSFEPDGDPMGGWPTAATNAILAQLATDFYASPHVLYGVSNEPQYNFDQTLDGQVWTRMNAAVAAIRAAENALGGAHHHIVTVQGTRDWARDLSYYAGNPITAGGGVNVAYETHIYNSPADFASLLLVGPPTRTIPVILGEFGPVADAFHNATAPDMQTLIDLATANSIPYLAWTFHQYCPPNLISDAAGMTWDHNSIPADWHGMPIFPTDFGQLLKNNLLAAAPSLLNTSIAYNVTSTNDNVTRSTTAQVTRLNNFGTEKRPVVVLMPGWGGLGDVAAVRDAQAMMFANQGYVALNIGFHQTSDVPAGALVDWYSDLSESARGALEALCVETYADCSAVVLTGESYGGTQTHPVVRYLRANGVFDGSGGANAGRKVIGILGQDSGYTLWWSAPRDADATAYSIAMIQNLGDLDFPVDSCAFDNCGARNRADYHQAAAGSQFVLSYCPAGGAHGTRGYADWDAWVLSAVKTMLHTQRGAPKFTGYVEPTLAVRNACAMVPPPTAATGAATGLTLTGATLNGTVNPNGSSTTALFDYGPSASYATQATAAPVPGPGSSPVSVSASITGLTCSTTYHFRVVATSAAGRANGADGTFATSVCQTLLVPTATTGAAAGVTLTGATLNGTVNPNGSSTTALFDYGLSTSYGTQATAIPSPGSGSSPVSVSAAITGLTCSTNYHFRLVATSAAGTTNGSDGTFATPTCQGLSINDPSIAEGGSGKSILAFTLSLSQASTSAVTVNYATGDGTAIAASDYTAASGTFTIPAGSTAKQLTILVQGDAAVESDETFTVTLSNAVGVTIGKTVGTGTILNDDPPVAATTVTQYRLYHDGTKEHLYTTDLNEYTVLGTVGWLQEGIAYKMLTNGIYNGVATVPLFRAYHPGILQHHWTTDSNEAVTITRTPSWFYEATIGYLLPTQVSGTVPLYRMALASPPIHLWTTDLNEYTVLQGLGWIPEGIIGYVVP